ncbi:MAG: hypothetical protein ACLPTF_02810 [Steroidobacteraceae bacterium]
MKWRVALIDSCGRWPEAVDAAAFVREPDRIECRQAGADPTGHGSRIAEVLTRGRSVELLLGQVFTTAGPTSGAAVAAAIDWAIARRADLIHLSLGLAGNRAVLAAAVGRAIDADCIIVAAAPARGAVVYPAAYAGVIRATGDARCAPDELSCLAPGLFGACPRFEPAGQLGAGSARVGGASVGAAWVTRAIVEGPLRATSREVVAALTARARFVGPERKTSATSTR